MCTRNSPLNHVFHFLRSLAEYIALSSRTTLILRKQDDILSALDVIETGVRIFGYSHDHCIKNLDYSNRLHSFIVQPDDSHLLTEKSELL